jgi:hypothetical protein
MAADAHERPRELGQGGRRLYPWFEAPARRLAAELALDARHRRASTSGARRASRPLTAACLTADRAIDLVRLAPAGQRQRRCSTAAALPGGAPGSDQEASLRQLLGKLDGETSIASSKPSPWLSEDTDDLRVTRGPLDPRRRAGPLEPHGNGTTLPNEIRCSEAADSREYLGNPALPNARNFRTIPQSADPEKVLQIRSSADACFMVRKGSAPVQRMPELGIRARRGA